MIAVEDALSHEHALIATNYQRVQFSVYNRLEYLRLFFPAEHLRRLAEIIDVPNFDVVFIGATYQMVAVVPTLKHIQRGDGIDVTL